MRDRESDFLNLNIVLAVGDFVYFGIHRPPSWRVVVSKDKNILTNGEKVYNLIVLEHGNCSNSKDWFNSLEELTNFYGQFIEKHITNKIRI